MSHAFTFDAAFCSGCKACQVACKDKNNLPTGVLWRKVFEISGGDWSRLGSAWENNVFAYNLSMACNHCVHPKCAGVCPVNAYHVRNDGIVILDSTKCTGCGYCNWACPYAVPQFNYIAGNMSKCDFCADRVDVGGEPACVTACPLRVLGISNEIESVMGITGVPLWAVSASEHPFPLPDFSRTQPHLLLKPHPAMANKLQKVVANREEVNPATEKSELPLVFFTLLTQLGVGCFVLGRWIFAPLFNVVEPISFSERILVEAPFGLIFLFGMMIAFFHLGSKRNAWRMLSNLKKSWLSKEILFMSLFGLCWALSLFVRQVWLDWLGTLLGIGLIYSMANVYRLRSMAIWNTWRTFAGFILSVILLGLFVLTPFYIAQFGLRDVERGGGSQLPWLQIILGTALFFALGLEITAIKASKQKIHRARVGLILIVFAGVCLSNLMPGTIITVIYGFMLIGVLLEEGLGRWSFYEELGKRTLR